MEFKHLRLIKTIADLGSIARAKDELCLTTSALSHQLRSLEMDLGFKIFERRRVKWKLTESGEELYALATNILNSVDEKLLQIKSNHQSAGGKIRVSSECYTFYLLFPQFLDRMSALYPRIDIQLLYNTTHQPLENLLNYEVDIAMVTARPAQENLKCIKVLRDELLVVMHRENALSDSKYVVAKDFASQHLIIHSYPLETVSVYDKYLKPNQISPFKISAIPLTELSLEMVRANRGITCIPRWMLKPFAHQSELIFKAIGKNKLMREIYLVLREEDFDKPHFVDFVSNFQETIQSQFLNYAL
ncbi:LysR family transcriptional regulator [Marinoscillum pacificum]|uniref:LysR family transcriptional regulator n=1 Tax=Marinoscillum pacificum TaxID=392723 RepID=UPI0021578C9B|nr:LysR family transcriptional regulator [Marinoscillum pacificum]